MNAGLKRTLAAALGLALPVLAAASTALHDYAARWPLHAPAGASVLRLPLPAAVLTTLQSADARDLRIFNAAGQPVPLALDWPGSATAAVTTIAAEAPAPIHLPALPWLGEASAPSSAPLSLRIEPATGGALRLDLPATATPGPPPVQAGVLLDARAVSAAVTTLTLEAEWPEGRPVTFQAHASADLRQWQPLGSVTVYRHGAFGTPARMALDGAPLAGRYLRITWQGQGTDDVVQVRGARLLPAAAAGHAPAPRVAVPLALPADALPAGARAVEFTLPFATPLAALDIRLPGPSHLVPLRVLARQQHGQPWTPLARHVAYTLTDGNQVRHSPPVELGQAGWREWRIEADAATPGFAAPPRLTALLAPLQLVFVASGPGPYTLAAGHARATAAALPLSSLMPGQAPGAPQRLPLARLETAGPADAAVAAGRVAQAVAVQPVRQGPPPLRQTLLWAVLVLGVLALGGMAWALLRQLERRPPS